MTTNCSICLHQIKENNSCSLPCNHKFHYNCLFSWNLGHNSCPVCRTPIQTLVDNSEENSEDNLPNINQILDSSQIFNENQSSDIPNDFNLTYQDMDTISKEIKLTCKDCNTELMQCETCPKSFCLCLKNHKLYNGRNPFAPIEDVCHCLKCFMNRDEILIDYIFDDWPIDVFDMDITDEHYETFYNDTSCLNNLIIYQHYKKFDTYDSFVEHGCKLRDQELQQENSDFN